AGRTELSESEIFTSGTAAHGLYASAQNAIRSSIEFVDGSIHTDGMGSHGLLALGEKALIEAEGSIIAISGAQSIATYALEEGLIRLDGTIILEGDQTIGAMAENGSIQLGGEIIALGNSAVGLLALDGEIEASSLAMDLS